MTISDKYEQYGRARPKGKNRTSNNNGTKKKAEYFYDKLDGEEVEVTLINNEHITGTLHTTIMNKYDLLLNDILLPKHAVLYIIKAKSEQ